MWIRVQFSGGFCVQLSGKIVTLQPISGKMLTLFKKEINGFLNSLIGYIVIIVFLLMTGLFLWVFPMQFNILDFSYANLDGLFILGPFVFLFLIPAITIDL